MTQTAIELLERVLVSPDHASAEKARSLLDVTRPDSQQRRVAISVEYDGSGYRGWQTQKHDNQVVQTRLSSTIQNRSRADFGDMLRPN